MSFLKELEKNYSLFNITNGEIIELFHFPNDVYAAYSYLLSKANDKYSKNCEELGRDKHKLSKIMLGKDTSGKCYLMVVGNDNHTTIIIRSDDSKYEDYRGIVGTKITEEEFKTILDLIQREKLEKVGISSRFLRDEFLPLDICKEMNIPLLISYYQYINDYNNPIIMYDEPENSVGPIQRGNNPSAPRKNPIIDYELRKDELEKRNPKYTLEFKGRKTEFIYHAYIYERDGLTLVVVEPESGKGYQYNLNLGTVDKNNIELIKEMIKSALQAQEEIVMLDDAIIRKNHTTIDAFAESLDVFLNNAKKANKFYYDVKKSNTVYRR